MRRDGLQLRYRIMSDEHFRFPYTAEKNKEKAKEPFRPIIVWLYLITSAFGWPLGRTLFPRELRLFLGQIWTKVVREKTKDHKFLIKNRHMRPTPFL